EQLWVVFLIIRLMRLTWPRAAWAEACRTTCRMASASSFSSISLIFSIFWVIVRGLERTFCTALFFGSSRSFRSSKPSAIWSSASLSISARVNSTGVFPPVGKLSEQNALSSMAGAGESRMGENEPVASCQLPLSLTGSGAYTLGHGELPVDPPPHHGKPHLLCRGLQRPPLHQAAVAGVSCELRRVVHLHGDVRPLLRRAVRRGFSCSRSALAEAAIRGACPCRHRLFLVRRAVPLFGPDCHSTNEDCCRGLFLLLSPH